MIEEDVLKALGDGKLGFDELQSELKVSKKRLRTVLKSMTSEGSIATDGSVYWSTGGKNPKKNSSELNSYVNLTLLGLIVLLGFILRSYHMDYPVVGYHNWKETHYLTEARNFAREGFFKYGFFVPAWNYPTLYADPSGAHSDTFPTISIIVALMFMLFGPQLVIARLVGILFNTGAIVMMYLVMKKLFRREDIALISALLMATLPLLVFFSHNVDLINPGLFFMMAAAYFYLLWRESYSSRDMVLTSLFLTLAALTKYPFLVIAVPMFFTLPWKEFLNKQQRKERIASLMLGVRRQWKVLLLSLLIFSTLLLWVIYTNYYIGDKYGTQWYTLAKGDMIQMEVLSDPQWWATMKSYIRDNYTMLGLVMAGMGALVLVVMLVLHLSGKNPEFGLGDWFLFYYFLSTIPFATVMSYKLGGHSYHQYPIAPAVVMLIAYFIVKCTDLLKGFVKGVVSKKVAGVVVTMVFLSFFAVPWLGIVFPRYSEFCQSYGLCEAFGEVTARQFDTQFIGLDVAGEYIKAHSNPTDRIHFPSHQSYGVLWHSDRKGYVIGSNVSMIKTAEEKGANWFFIYQWGFSIVNDPERWNYVKENYGLRQMAYVNTNQGPQLIYILLKKGGKFDENNLSSAGREVKRRDYEFTFGKQTLYYVDFEE